jgi:hypothetical protein
MVLISFTAASSNLLIIAGFHPLLYSANTVSLAFWRDEQTSDLRWVGLYYHFSVGVDRTDSLALSAKGWSTIV